MKINLKAYKYNTKVILDMLKSINFFKSSFITSKWIYFFLFFLILLLINIRQKKITNYDCEICADKAGYYMYLPAFFYLGFKAANYPEGFDEKHGSGFKTDRINDKIITKYTCGLAILLAPFYGLGFSISKVFSLKVDPYSSYYLFFINIGAAFYAVLGLFYLRKWLNFYVNATNSLLAILVIFFGTNLYYYTLDESLMTHMYSFFLLSLGLYSFKSYCNRQNFKYYLMFAIAMSFAIAIRPINALFGLIIILFDVKRFKDLINKLVLILTPKNLFFGILIFTLIILPQALYWKFAFGKYIIWSYQGEGFSYWDNPQFLTVWFSPFSGLFIYTPIILLALIFSIVMIMKRIPNGILIFGTFVVLSYMCAAWADPFYGCSFGKRPMVEYLPVIMMPTAYMFENFKEYTKSTKYIIIASAILLIYYNLALFEAFNTCFPGHYWEWNKFLELFKDAILFIK